MIEKVAKRVVERVLTGIEEAAEEELPDGLSVERDGDKVVVSGKSARLKVLTGAWLVSLVRAAVRRR